MTRRAPVNLLRQRWLSALRNRRYKQSNERLLTHENGSRAKPDAKHPAGHCALGVMCEVYFTFHPEWGWNLPGEAKERAIEPSRDIPPPAILEAFRVPSGFAYDLARMNDRGYSFKRLADHLEAVWARESPPDEASQPT